MSGLPDSDRRLAHEIAAGVLRARVELDRRLTELVTAPWRRVPADLRDVLRIGAYQLLKLTRVPRYAAVETAVSLARTAHGGKGGAGMVNAVLRRLADSAPRLAGPDADSHPAWLVERWRDHFGRARTDALVAHNDRPRPLVIHPVRWSKPQLEAALHEAGIGVYPVMGDGLAVEAGRVTGLPGYAAGAFVVQDPAQSRVLDFAAIPDGARLWDACAAPGGKAAVLARRCRVVASDASRHRLRRLAGTARRAAPGVMLAAADARHPPIAGGAADAVLLDAPCTATGTLARHPDARWKLTPRRLAVAARLQAELLDGVAPIPRRGGVLVYATCSLEPEENDQQVSAFLARHPEYRRSRDDLFVFPPEHDTDGAYAARLERIA